VKDSYEGWLHQSLAESKGIGCEAGS